MLPAYASADVFEVSTTFASGHFVRGVDVTDSQPVLFLNADYSFDGGLFAGAECYQSNAEEEVSLARACQANIGYFKPLLNNQALEFSLAYADYQRRRGSQWDYFKVGLDWHLNQNLLVSFSASDDWFGRGFSSLAIDAGYRHRLTDNISAIAKGGMLVLEGNAPENYFEYFEVGLQFSKSRWSVGINAFLTDDDISSVARFETDRSGIKLNLSYQLY